MMGQNKFRKHKSSLSPVISDSEVTQTLFYSEQHVPSHVPPNGRTRPFIATNTRTVRSKMISENKPKRLKQLFRVDVSRNVPYEKIVPWTRHIADEVFRSIAGDEEDIDIVVTLDFSRNKGMRKSVKKIIMDTLEEELLR